MLFLILVLCLCRTLAAPISAAGPATAFALPSSDCANTGNNRGILDIVWSCLVTIFACTWITVHPNVPGPDDTPIMSLLRRTKLMLYALIMPEAVLLWAMRQWLGARNITKHLNESYHLQGPLFLLTQFYLLTTSPDEKRWTLTHGHFLQMGGFMVYQDGKPHHPLSTGWQRPHRINLRFRDKIEFPTITKREIEDRSKADFFSKALVIIQTTWFVVQSIARRKYRLVITPLELVTLAFATINALMYYFWWHKPLDVRCPVPVYLQQQPQNKKQRQGKHISRDRSVSDARTSHSIATSQYAWHETESGSTFHGIFGHLSMDTLLRRPFIKPFTEMAKGYSSIETNALKVPTFYTSKADSVLSALFGSFCIGIVFGAVHLTGWSFDFQTHAERLIWRISSIIIVSEPVFVVFYLLVMLSFMLLNFPPPNLAMFFGGGKFAEILGVIAVLAYVLARITLLVLAIISLRKLDSSALVTIAWTDYIPHI